MTQNSPFSNADFVMATPAAAARLVFRDKAKAVADEAVAKDVISSLAARELCEKALGKNIHVWLAKQPLEVLVDLFRTTEAEAPKAERRHIAAHPLRPEEVQALVDADVAEADARKKAEREARRLEAARKRAEQYERDLELIAQAEAEAQETESHDDAKSSGGKGRRTEDGTTEA